MRQDVAPAGSQWWSEAVRPCTRLERAVDPYVVYREWADGPVRRLEAPQPRVVVIVNTGAPLTVATGAGPSRTVGSFVAGLGPTPSTVGHDGAQQGVELRLSPPAARRLLDVPLHELADHVIDLEDLLGAAGRRIEEQVAAAEDAVAVGRVIDAALGASPVAGTSSDVVIVQRLWETLVAHHGGVEIQRLFAPTGWSRRRASAAFREHIGVTPKVAARILRLQRAIALMDDGAQEGMATVANRSGYVDQGHLIREFNALVGMTPGRYQTARLGNLPGIGAAPAET